MSRRTTMAVLLRRGQWLLDEAAFEIGGGRYTPGQCRDAAHALAELATTLDEYSHENTATGTRAEADSQAQPNEQPAEQPHTPAQPLLTRTAQEPGGAAC